MSLGKHVKSMILLFVIPLVLSFVNPSHAYLIMPSGYTFSRNPDFGWINGVGQYTYSDTNKAKLTDGIKGQDDWTQDYTDWVGWWGISYQGDKDNSGNISKGDYADNPVTITFNFQQSFQLSSISLWTNQDAIHNFNVVYPGSVTIMKNGNQLFSLESAFSKGRSGGDNGYNNGRLHEIALDMGTQVDVGDEISITLSNWNIFDKLDPASNGDWIYHDILWNNDPNSTHNGMFWMFLSEVEFKSPTPVPEPSTMLLMGSGLLLLLMFSMRRVES